jgi:RNA polymerase sigma-70 factor (ECF subfamily)
MNPSTLSDLLRVRARTQRGRPDPRATELEAQLREIIRSAQDTFPTIALAPDAFVAHLGDRLAADVPPTLALRQMHTADLYLACACQQGDVHAFDAFDQRCLRRLDPVLGKMGIGGDATAEVKQDIRSRVLAGVGGRALIGDFTGRGDLRGWVRVMAVRLALQLQRRGRREAPLEDDDDLLHQLVAPGSPESDQLKGIYRQEFKRAFEAALRALPGRERTLLRQHHIDGLTIDEIGALYRVHRSTAARLLVRARELVLEATRAQLMSRFDVTPRDLDSILRMIRSQIEVSLHALVRARNR